MRSLGTVIVVAVVLSGCREVLAALGVTDVDIPADSYSVAEGRTWEIPVNIIGCDSTPDYCVTWHSDNGCVVSFATGATASAVHFGTARVDVEAIDLGGGDDHAVVTVTQQTPVRLQLAKRFLPVARGSTAVLSVKLFDASDHELHRPAAFTSADTTVIVVQGVDPGCGGMWPDGVQIRGVRTGSTFIFGRFENLVDSVSVTVL
jgi:hypothetical protein